MVWYSHLFQNFPQFIVIHTVKGFGIVNKAEIDIFLELSCFFNDPVDVGNLISGSSAFSKTSLNIWNTVHLLLKPGLENFEHYFTREHIKKQIHHFADKDSSSQSYGFSSTHVWESCTMKKTEHQRVDAFELWCWRRLLKSPLHCKKIKPVNPNGNQS